MVPALFCNHTTGSFVTASARSEPMRRNCLFFLLVVGGLTLGLAMTLARARAQSASPQSPAMSPSKLAEEQIKNIQALKGVPAEQLVPSMQFISASLGVECEYCHVRGAFEKDDKKPKQTARKMIAMMFAINKDNFEGHREVTCYSCHRGSTDPVATPAVVGGEPTRGMSKAKSIEDGEAGGPSGPSADQLLEKYLTAVGGAAAVEKITSRVMKGTITFGDRNIAIDNYSKDPDKRVSFTHTPEGDSITAFDGHEGWLGVPKRPVREMHGPDIDAAAMDADLHFPAHLKATFSELKVKGKETFGD